MAESLAGVAGLARVPAGPAAHSFRLPRQGHPGIQPPRLGDEVRLSEAPDRPSPLTGTCGCGPLGVASPFKLSHTFLQGAGLLGAGTQRPQ